MATEYRTVGDGWTNWLEYRHTFKILWFKWRVWLRVESDHYDEWMYEGITTLDYEIYINSYNYNLEKFVQQWPNIEDWEMHRTQIVKEKFDKLEAKKQRRKQNNSGIKKLS